MSHDGSAMNEAPAAPTVIRNDERNRYELKDGDELAGFAVFELSEGGRIAFTHTQIDKAFRGRGFGDIIASESLADAARRGETIVPLCPFIASYLKDHEVPGGVIDWPDESDAQESATTGESAG
ncbi:Predicted acetyltransferase [Microbacterium sp. C448]|uniref:GNAT family N-acetyltransferase n=1 Tax=Microbacterium TaxID=33882 RepID=UPI0003DE5EAA|nr:MULTISPECIES: GNAT family N-acetyltransferase [Microbacterium]MDO8382604.1 GNAT family N-acetyltransferase [Microbacterium sp.]CDK01898.1 Predicted acetyltransferase [Microbacterium sp. C448]